jgi:hypothetical protein
MVAALQSLATVKEDMVQVQQQMTSVIKTNELQISVLKNEVETAADFLIEQEARICRAN